MPRRKNGRRARNGNRRGGLGPFTPQRLSGLIDLTKFQPRRRIVIASETDLTILDPSKIEVIGSFGTPPGIPLGSTIAFIKTFDEARIVSIDVYYDQRGAGSTGAVPRATAWVANDVTTVFNPNLVQDIARFAGSGLSQITPGKAFRITVGPEYFAGQFSRLVNNGSIIITSKDYVGVVRFQTTFEVYGPPLDIRLQEPLEVLDTGLTATILSEAPDEAETLIRLEDGEKKMDDESF
jgi:hypothetical protein